MLFYFFWKQLMQIVGRTWLNLVTWTCRSWSEGQHDLYFMVQWFCLISWRLFDACTSYFGIMNQYDSMINPQSKRRSLWPIFHSPVILPCLLKTIWCMIIIIRVYESVWPLFHGLVILLNIFKIIWWTNIIVGIIDKYDTKIDLIKYM